jgi:hypothetical protein
MLGGMLTLAAVDSSAFGVCACTEMAANCIAAAQLRAKSTLRRAKATPTPHECSARCPCLMS